MKLEKYQWAQIQAALVFWAHAAEYSTVPPQQHPIASKFLDGQRPMSQQEILDLASTPYFMMIGLPTPDQDKPNKLIPPATRTERK